METSKIASNPNNYSMPRGALTFAPFNDDGENTGEVDLGNCTSFELTNGIEYKEHMTSHDNVVILDAKKPASQKWTVKFAPDELSAENMAMFLLGDPDKQKGTTPDRFTQTVTQEDETITIRYDRWIELGGFKYITPGTISVTGDQGTITITELTSGNYTNYRVDYENGMVMFKSTCGEDDGTVASAIFEHGSCSLKKFTARIRPLVGFLRYRGLSEVGPRHSVKCWKVQITPDAALTLIKPTDYASMSFTGDVFIDDDTNSHRATDPFFEILELDEAIAYS